MQVSKWGDSLAVRLPKELVEEMGLAVGDELNVVDFKGKTSSSKKIYANSRIWKASPR